MDREKRLQEIRGVTRRLAEQYGRSLESAYPAQRHPSSTLTDALPGGKDLEEIAEELTFFIAEVLQSWLDAGSERDVTMEELYDPIYKHLHGWSVDWKEEQ